MSDIISFGPVRAWDRDGIATPGALAYFYLSGTTTPQLVYTTEALDVAHPVPLEADANGVFPPVFSAVALRCTVTDSAGVTLPGYPIDPVAKIATGSGASEITFEPTGDIPETNVQAAIERVQANLVAPLLAGGIGVTGNAEALADIDATDTPSGAYRFTTGATGTFPIGVIASGGGTIRLWRETANEAVMMLNPRGSQNMFLRVLTGGAWGAWGSVATNASATGVDVVRAATPQDTRNVIVAPTRPSASEGAGQFRAIIAGVGTALVLPADGTWAYFYNVYTAGGENITASAGVAAGGTTLSSTSDVKQGFAWRVNG